MTSYDKWLDEITEHVRKKKIAETAATFSVGRVHEAIEELEAEFTQFMANEGARFVHKGEVGDTIIGEVGDTILVDEPICPEFTVFDAAWSAPVWVMSTSMNDLHKRIGFTNDPETGRVHLWMDCLMSFVVQRDQLDETLERMQQLIDLVKEGLGTQEKK